MVMKLIESRGQMYTWVTHECNPIRGKCEHDCTYCYMKKWGEQKPIHVDWSFLDLDLGQGRTIFMVSGADMFTKEIPDTWIIPILMHCRNYDNTYLFQSKNPTRFHEFWEFFPKKSVFCTTIETNRIYLQMGKTPSPVVRSKAMNLLDGDKYVTIEPIMDFDVKELVDLIRDCNPIQVNIGADSKGHGLIEPSKEKLLALIEELKKFTVIDQKRNLSRLLI
jgi:DNA repair photolyase